MKTFTLHMPREARPGDPEALERAEVVKDGFAWGAFFFTVLWFWAQRLWLAGFAVLVVLIAFNLGLAALKVHPAAFFFAQLLLSFLIGLEANSLRRWTLGRRGLPVADAVTASDRDEAEAKTFARWLAGGAPRPLTTSAAPSYRQGASQPVIGLFPEPDRPR